MYKTLTLFYAHVYVCVSACVRARVCVYYHHHHHQRFFLAAADDGNGKEMTTATLYIPFIPSPTLHQCSD